MREPRELETPGAPVVLRPRRPARSNRAYVLCFLALLARSHLKLDALALLEVAVAIHLDRGVVNEHVGACFTGNEAVTLLAVEPLHGSGSCHFAPINPTHARCRGPASASWSSSHGSSSRHSSYASVRLRSKALTFRSKRSSGSAAAGSDPCETLAVLETFTRATKRVDNAIRSVAAARWQT